MKLCDDLDRAIDHIEAVQISPLRWAHRDAGTKTWWIVTTRQMRALAALLRDPDQTDAYDHWCATHKAKEMPEKWAP